jgi:hypothetical protein
MFNSALEAASLSIKVFLNLNNANLNRLTYYTGITPVVHADMVEQFQAAPHEVRSVPDFLHEQTASMWIK